MNRRLRLWSVVLAALVMSPTLAVAQVSITELGAANAARNQMMGDSAQATAGAKPAGGATSAAGTASATKSVNFGGMKYTLSYALMLMLVGLGLYLVCRPAHRHDAE